jgi:predicted transcriptional regulator
MASTLLRVDQSLHRQVRKLADDSGQTMGQVLHAAITHYERQLFLQQLKEDFARLKSDPVAWKEELAERLIYEGTLADGLEDDDYARKTKPRRRVVRRSRSGGRA